MDDTLNAFYASETGGLIGEAEEYEQQYKIARQQAKALAKKNGWTFDQALASFWSGARPKLKKKPMPGLMALSNGPDFDKTTQEMADAAIRNEFGIKNPKLPESPALDVINQVTFDAMREDALRVDNEFKKQALYEMADAIRYAAIEKAKKQALEELFGRDVPGVDDFSPGGFVSTTDTLKLVEDEDDKVRAQKYKSQVEALEKAYADAMMGGGGMRVEARIRTLPLRVPKPTAPPPPLSKHGRVILPEED